MTYRLTAIAIVSMLVLAACSGSSSLDTTTTAAETTTTVAEETTTTGSPDDSVTTTVPMVEPEGAPTTELNSFAATSLVDVDLGGNPVTVATNGTRVGDTFECTSVITVQGTALENAAVVSPDGAWVDDGSGFVQVDPIAIEDLIVGCPVHPVFWVDFDIADFPDDLTGEPDVFNGIPAQRLDFADRIEDAQGMALAEDLVGASFDRMDIWVADDGGWIVGMYIDATLDAEATARAFGGNPGGEDADARLVMDIQIAQPDDPTLNIEIPTTD